jgi:hypothetical protein
MNRLPARARDRALRRVIAAIGVAGSLLCASLFAVSWLHPAALESWARQAIAQQVQARVERQLEGLSNASIGRFAGGVIDRNSREKAVAQAQIASKLPSSVALVIGAIADPVCGCRDGAVSPERLAAFVDKVKRSENAQLRASIGKLDRANARLTALIASKYRDVADALLSEVRIFSGANGALFLLLALIATFWKRSALQLLAPAIVLTGAAAITGSLYLFQQNWLHTILLSEYVGLAYFPYLGLALMFMVDIVFNRARGSYTVASALGAAIALPVGAGC